MFALVIYKVDKSKQFEDILRFKIRAPMTVGTNWSKISKFVKVAM